MKAFYHKSDLDGHCSGAIVKLKHPECEMIGIDYDDKIGEMGIDNGETIYIVDFSCSLESMRMINDNCDLHWIDHHKSAIEKVGPDFDSATKGMRAIGKAGCELTWEYLFPNQASPLAVKLLGRYDVWDHKDPLVLPFQYGFRNFEDTKPDSHVWKMFLVRDTHGSMDDINNVVDTGNIILSYQQKQDKIYSQGMAFSCVFEGLRAVCVNKSYCNSKLFDSVYDPNKHDLMIAFGYNGKWKYSLYSTKDAVDCSSIAKQYGGGGHKGAAGFYSDKMVLQ